MSEFVTVRVSAQHFLHVQPTRWLDERSSHRWRLTTTRMLPIRLPHTPPVPVPMRPSSTLALDPAASARRSTTLASSQIPTASTRAEWACARGRGAAHGRRVRAVGSAVGHQACALHGTPHRVSRDALPFSSHSGANCLRIARIRCIPPVSSLPSPPLSVSSGSIRQHFTHSNSPHRRHST